MSAAQSSRRRVSRGLRVAAWAIPLALMIGAGGYVAAAATAPLPQPEFVLLDNESAIVGPDNDTAQTAVDARSLPTAIGWLHGDDEDVWSNDEGTYPLGSITKLIMVLVSMEQKPLEPGDDGDTYIWTAADAARTADYMAVNGVAYDIPVGSELTQRDMLKFIFLPSANDVAYTYALWTFGSNDAFLEALDGWKAEHGLSSISLVEPTGMELEDQASPADLVRVARLALQNPTITEFTSMQYAEMPWGIGTIENSNPLLGVMPGIVGTKTGTIWSSYNLIVAQEIDVEGRAVTSIAIALDRPSLEARADSGRLMLNAMQRLPQPVGLVTEGEVIGKLIGVDGSTAELVTAGSATATMLPGDTAVRSVDASAEGGTVTIELANNTIEVPLTLNGTITEPDFWWRITNPKALFFSNL